MDDPMILMLALPAYYQFDDLVAFINKEVIDSVLFMYLDYQQLQQG
jgi:hypothetical protein